MFTYGGKPLAAPTTFVDGTHRAATLDETWRRFAPKRRAAQITRLAELTGLDTLGIPVWAAIRPLGRSLSTQQGKGVTSEAARISALMESLETYAAEHATLPIVRGSYRALAKRRAVVDVQQLPRAVKKLDLDARWAWVEGRDLATDAPILVPYESVTLDTTFVRAPVFDVSSNGLASGNVLVEAIVHGLCEVIERDAEAAWRRSGSDRRIVIDTVSSPAVHALVARVVATGARIFLWDLTTDLAVPVIGCAIMEDPREPMWRPLGMYQGFGAHLDPEIAMLRAITEAAQTRLTYIAGARDDFFPADYARATDPQVLARQWERYAAPPDDSVDAADLPRAETADLGEELDVLVARLAAFDFTQIIVVDLTHPTLRVPTVKVIVPGLANDVEVIG